MTVKQLQKKKHLARKKDKKGEFQVYKRVTGIISSLGGVHPLNDPTDFTVKVFVIQLHVSSSKMFSRFHRFNLLPGMIKFMHLTSAAGWKCWI